MKQLSIYICLAMSVLACQPVRIISTEKLSNRRAENAKTFAFAELTKKVKVNVVNSQLTENFIMQTLVEEMEDRGYVYSENDPDVLLDLEIYYRSLRPREQSNYNNNYNRFGYGGYRYYRYGDNYRNDPRLQDGVDKGMVARINLTLGQGDEKVLLWTGTVESRLSQNASKRMEHLELSVVYLLNGFENEALR